MALTKISINLSESTLETLDKLVDDFNKDLNEVLPGRKNIATRADIIEICILDQYEKKYEKNI